MNEPFLFQNLSERITELFPEIDSDTTTKLLHTNEEYQKLYQRKKELLEQCPFITALMYGDGPVSLNTEEHKKFVDYLNIVINLENIERMQLYFRGHMDGFSYLKKIEAI